MQTRDWEIDWSRRCVRRTKKGTKAHFVWARSPNSRRKECREWHWVWAQAIRNAGIQWIPPERELLPPMRHHKGYLLRGPKSMTAEEIALADGLNLWIRRRAGNRRSVLLLEHRLEAAKKYGLEVVGRVVRHVNGIKTDNRSENLILGTVAENNADHNTARLEMMAWRERAEAAERRVAELEQQLQQNEQPTPPAAGFSFGAVQ